MISAQLSRTETSQKTEKLTKKKLKKRDALSALLKMQVITSRRFLFGLNGFFHFSLCETQPPKMPEIQ